MNKECLLTLLNVALAQSNRHVSCCDCRFKTRPKSSLSVWQARGAFHTSGGDVSHFRLGRFTLRAWTFHTSGVDSSHVRRGAQIVGQIDPNGGTTSQSLSRTPLIAVGRSAELVAAFKSLYRPTVLLVTCSFLHCVGSACPTGGHTCHRDSGTASF